MNKIISKEHFSEKVFKLVIEAPLIAKSRKAGHFVIVRVGEKGERMPRKRRRTFAFFAKRVKKFLDFGDRY